MRQPRVKIPSNERAARYHAMSRSVNGEFYFKKTDREIFCAMVWKVADFCGLDVLTFVILANHFHIKLHVPRFGPLTDEELLRRYEVLHRRSTKYSVARIAAIREMLRVNGADAVAWRKRQLRLMGDLSQFMKLLKQRFSICYNRTHNRFGTLWAERFKSVLTEHQDRDEASLCTAIYIDLNAVRAGIVRDPKDYLYCGYGAAVGGDERARRGIMMLTKAATWQEAQAIYRRMLFAAAAGLTRKGCAISQEDFERVLQQKGILPVSTTLLCRMRYLTNTLVLGSQTFVERHLEIYRRKTGAPMRAGPRPLPPNAAWSDLFALRTPKART